MKDVVSCMFVLSHVVNVVSFHVFCFVLLYAHTQMVLEQGQRLVDSARKAEKEYASSLVRSFAALTNFAQLLLTDNLSDSKSLCMCRTLLLAHRITFAMSSRCRDNWKLSSQKSLETRCKSARRPKLPRFVVAHAYCFELLLGWGGICGGNGLTEGMFGVIPLTNKFSLCTD